MRWVAGGGGTDRRAPVVLLVLLGGALVTLAASVVQDHSFSVLDVGRPVPERLVVMVLAGWAFVLAGLVGLRSRPLSNTGWLMIAVGMLWLGKEAVGLPRTAALLPVVGNLALAVLAHVFLAFPTGRLSGWERPAGAVWYGWTVGGSLVGAMFDPFWPSTCTRCPDHLLLIRDDPALSETIGDVVWAGVATMVAILAVVLARRWWTATPVGRQRISPLAVALLPPLVAAVALPTLSRSVGWHPLSPRQTIYVSNAALIVLPAVILGELLRSRLAHARVSDLLRHLPGPLPAGQLEDLLAKTVGDGSLRLAFPRNAGTDLVDTDGNPVSLPAGDPTSTVTRVENDAAGAVVIHDAAVDRDLVQSTVAAARLSLENARLQAEVRAQLEELRRSRARIATAADTERRKVERDLHDGAQQQIMALAMTLDRASRQVPGSLSDEVRELLEQAKAEAARAIHDLRNLARGIYPPVLTDEGLAAALESFTDRVDLPVDLRVAPGRYPQHLEAVLYFVVAEGLTNTTKHANATRATVHLAGEDRTLVLEVHDDGEGGADPEGGGLRGLRDRVEAAGGTLEVTDRDQGGTTIRAVLPIDDE